MDIHFNSIKVRLELKATLMRVAALHPFQFHKGAIRTESGVPLAVRVVSFQFHKGAIRTRIT